MTLSSDSCSSAADGQLSDDKIVGDDPLPQFLCLWTLVSKDSKLESRLFCIHNSGVCLSIMRSRLIVLALHNITGSRPTAIFYAQRTMLSQDVRLFVRLSVTRWYIFSRTTIVPIHIFKLFSPSGSHAILVFFPNQTVWQYSDGDPLGSNVRSMKKSRFSTDMLLYLGNDTRYSHSYSSIFTIVSRILDLSNGAIFNDLEWPLTRVSRTRHYLTLNVSETVRDNDILIGTYTRPTQQCHFNWSWVT